MSHNISYSLILLYMELKQNNLTEIYAAGINTRKTISKSHFQITGQTKVAHMFIETLAGDKQSLTHHGHCIITKLQISKKTN